MTAAWRSNDRVHRDDGRTSQTRATMTRDSVCRHLVHCAGHDLGSNSGCINPSNGNSAMGREKAVSTDVRGTEARSRLGYRLAVHRQRQRGRVGGVGKGASGSRFSTQIGRRHGRPVDQHLSWGFLSRMMRSTINPGSLRVLRQRCRFTCKKPGTIQKKRQLGVPYVSYAPKSEIEALPLPLRSRLGSKKITI